MSNDIELKPCPFCGGDEVEYFSGWVHDDRNRDASDFREPSVSCAACGVGTRSGSYGRGITDDEAKADTLSHWNTRPAVTDGCVSVAVEWLERIRNLSAEGDNPKWSQRDCRMILHMATALLNAAPTIPDKELEARLVKKDETISHVWKLVKDAEDRCTVWKKRVVELQASPPTEQDTPKIEGTAENWESGALGTDEKFAEVSELIPDSKVMVDREDLRELLSNAGDPHWMQFPDDAALKERIEALLQQQTEGEEA